LRAARGFASLLLDYCTQNTTAGANTKQEEDLQQPHCIKYIPSKLILLPTRDTRKTSRRRSWSNTSCPKF